MVELIVLGGVLWWLGKKGKAALEEASLSETDFRLAKLAEKHCVPYETWGGKRLTWDEAPPDPDATTPGLRVEVHDHRAIHQHVHFHVHRDGDA